MRTMLAATIALAAAPALAMDAAVTLARGACEARCAVYEVRVGGDGAVLYEGRHFVRRAGKVKRRIAPAAAAALLTRFADRAFLDLPETIAPGASGCAPAQRVGSRLEITFAGGTAIKRVVLDGRCDGALAEQLRGLARAVDEVSGAGALAR